MDLNPNTGVKSVSHKDKLEEEVAKYEELHKQIQAGDEQLTAMKQERDRKVGRIQVLQELEAESPDSPAEG